MSVPNAPCQNCIGRKQGCHDSCERYQAYRKRKLEYNLQMASIKKTNSYFQEGAMKHHKGQK